MIDVPHNRDVDNTDNLDYRNQSRNRKIAMLCPPTCFKLQEWYNADKGFAGETR